MRVVYFSNSYLPSMQANSVHVVNMASALGGLGHEVVLYASRGDLASLEGEGRSIRDRIAAHYGVPGDFDVRFFRHPPIPGRSTFGAIEAVIRQRIAGTDLVIGRDAKSCALAAFSGFDVLFETHQPISNFPAMERLLLRRAISRKAFRGIVTISRPLQKILCAQNDIDSGYVLVAHDAATDVPVSPSGRRRGERPIVGYTGHLYEGRGIEIIVALARRLKDLDFLVMGGTEDDVARWRDRTSDLANIRFSGFLAPSVAAQSRAECSVLLAPYQHNTSVPGGLRTADWMSPLKVFEYMASGVPFVCSDLPVLHEILEDRRNCLLVNPSDVDAWESAVNGLIADPATAQTIARLALDEFRQHYTWRARAKRLVDYASGGGARI